MSTVFVKYIDAAKVMEAAREAGWIEGDGDSLMDFIEVEDFAIWRECTSLTKAKAWARRHASRDLWNDPRIEIFEKKERVKLLCYIGDGAGWVEQ